MKPNEHHGEISDEIISIEVQVIGGNRCGFEGEGTGCEDNLGTTCGECPHNVIIPSERKEDNAKQPQTNQT